MLCFTIHSHVWVNRSIIGEEHQNLFVAPPVQVDSVQSKYCRDSIGFSFAVRDARLVVAVAIPLFPCRLASATILLLSHTQVFSG